MRYSSDKPTEAKTIVIDRQSYGVRIELAKPLRVVQRANKTILVELVALGGDKPAPAEEVALTCRLLPYVGKP